MVATNIKNAKQTAAAGSSNQASCQHFRASFSDLDDLAATAQAWSLDFRRINAEPFRGSLTQINVRDIRYDCAHFTAPLQQRGSPPPGRWTFAIPDAAEPRMIWRGRTTGRGTVAVYHPGSEIDALSRPGFFMLPVAMTPETMERHLRALDMPRFDRILADDIIEIDPVRLHRLARVLRSAIEALDADSGLLQQQTVRSALSERMPRLVLRILANGRPHRRPERTGDTIRACLSIIEASRAPLTVAQLASLVGVSGRAVQQAFATHLGVTPK
ncbi:MAG: hypothetical protein AAFX05_10410, partial [Planctomycetota bacterium]